MRIDILTEQGEWKEGWFFRDYTGKHGGVAELHGEILFLE